MAKKLVSDFERIRRKTRTTGDHECWQWEGTLDRDGYGAQVKVGSRTDGSRRAVRPYRWMYEHVRGPIPAGMVIDHLCRNRACVNPWHLEVVTPEENTRRAYLAKTHCKRGHELSGRNLIIRAGTRYRRCRTCQNAASNAFGKATNWAAQRKYKRKSGGLSSATATGL